MKDLSEMNPASINEYLADLESTCNYDLPRLPEGRVPTPNEIQEVEVSLRRIAQNAEGKRQRAANKIRERELGTRDTPSDHAPGRAFDAHR